MATGSYCSAGYPSGDNRSQEGRVGWDPLQVVSGMAVGLRDSVILYTVVNMGGDDHSLADWQVGRLSGLLTCENQREQPTEGRGMVVRRASYCAEEADQAGQLGAAPP
jgi:hypothetical protein